MAARAYWARPVAEMEQNATSVGAVGAGREQAELAGEAAGGVHRRASYDDSATRNAAAPRKGKLVSKPGCARRSVRKPKAIAPWAS